MTSQIKVFNFKGEAVRTAQEDGEVWFVAKDISDVLEYSESSNPARLFQSVPEQWKGVKPIHTPYGVQNMVTVTEQGVYFFLGRSDKPKALPFQMWIANDVLPSIRTNGAYMTPETIEKTLTNPDFIIGLATRLKEEQSRSRALEIKTLQDAPKVLFADAVAVSSSEILVGDLAKLLRQNGVEVGQKRLFKRLRDDGFLMSRGDSYNMPTQRSMEMGLFRIKETVINKPDGTVLISRTVKVCGKGQLYFVNYFLKKDAA